MKFVRTGNGNISAFVEGQSYHIPADTANYDVLYEALQTKNLALFQDNIVDANRLNVFCEGYIDFSSGIARWDGVPMPSLFTDRILELVQRGEEFGPMIKFTLNLADNPSEHSILELVDFLRNKNLPITEDGCFLAYKAVTNDYKDIYSEKIDNSVGNTVSVERSDVDDNRNRECSHGLHVGAIDYVNKYADWKGGEHNTKKVIVKVNPKDVVSVPKDENFQKLRCCEYIVISDYEQTLENPVYDDAVFLDTEEPKTESPAIEEYIESQKRNGSFDWVTNKLRKLADLIGRNI